MSQTCRFPWSVAVFALAATQSPAAADRERYDPPVVFSAQKLLPAEALRGPHHEVLDEVTNDGFFNRYTIVSSGWGQFLAESDTLLGERLKEVHALAELARVNEALVAAGSLADSTLELGKAAVHVAKNPKQTAEGLADGAEKLAGWVGRTFRRTKEKADSALAGQDQSQADAEQGGSRARAAGAATASLAKSVFGVNAAAREWARKLGIDPYTTNEVMRRELERIASFDAAGGFATRIVPAAAILGMARQVDKWVYEMPPDALLTLNEQRLQAMGVTEEVSQAFRLNGHYGLTRQTRLVAALHTLEGVAGRPDFVDRAAGATSELGAQFHQESAELLRSFHAEHGGLVEILPGLAGAVARARSGRIVSLLPVDYLTWNERLALGFQQVEADLALHSPSAQKEAWLTGGISGRARRRLQSRGWSVRPQAIRVEPAPQPVPSPAPQASPSPEG